MPTILDSDKQHCTVIGAAGAAYAQAIGPMSPQLSNYGWGSPNRPGIRSALHLPP